MRTFARHFLLLLISAFVGVSSAAAAPEIKPEAARHFLKAVELQDAGKLDQAVEQYRAGLKIEPKSVPALTNLSIIYIQKKQYASAEAAYIRILGIEPRNEPVLEQLVRVMVEQGKYKEALSYARKLHDAKPGDRGRAELLAVVYTNLKDYASASEIYRTIVNSSPRDEAAHENLAACYAAAGKHADVLAVMNELLKFSPKSPKGRMTAAYAAEKLGKNSLALEHYEAASTGPAAVSALLNAARLYKILDQPEKGVEALERLLEVDPDNFDALYNLGAYEYGRQNWPVAVRHWNAAKRVQPRSFDVNVNLAMALAREGSYKEALECTKVAIDVRPKDALALEAHAYVLENLPDSENAAKVYRRWQQYYPSDYLPGQKLAVLLYGIGKKGEAYAELDKALKKSSEPAELLSTYGELLLADGQPGKACEYFTRAVDARPSHVPMMLRAASCLQQDKKNNEAVAMLTRAVGADPDNRDARIRLAVMHRELGKPDQAIAQYRRLLEIDPQDHVAAMQLAQLYSETGDHAASAGVYRKLLDGSDPAQARLVRQMLGEELELCGDYTGALEQYAELAKATDPLARADAMIRSAGILEKQNKHKEAIEAYKSAIEIQPDEAVVMALGRLYESQQRSEEFLVYLKSLVDSREGDLPYRYFARLYRTAGKSDAAIQSLQKAAERNPENIQLSLLLAAELEASGDSASAAERYRSVIGKYPEEPTGHRKLGELLLKAGQKSEAVDHLAVASRQLPNDAKLLRQVADLFYFLNRRSEALGAYRLFLEKHDPANQEVKLRVGELESPEQ